MHDLTIILTLAGGLGAALLMGWLTQRLGLSTLVGYMLAGIIVGPYTPGFVADRALASQMAEIGVILLMFGVGLHFHPQDLLRVWRIAVPGAVVQSVGATVAGWAIARAFGWSHAAGLVFGMSLAVASTVVLTKMLINEERLSERDGHVAMGWLIVEDFFTVLALVILPVIAVGSADPSQLGPSLLKALALTAGFAVLVWVVGTRVVFGLMERLAKTHSSELFTLFIFVTALGVAVLAANVFHVSVALGAFFAGLVLGQSRFGAQAAHDMAPFRDVFAALFFVSVGMLFNPVFVLEQPLLVLAAVAVVLLLKPAAAWLIVRLLRDTRRTGATVSVGLAQIGEFSFILASLGVSMQVLPPAAMDALVAAAIVSIGLNPVLFKLVRDRWAGADAAAREAAAAAESAKSAEAAAGAPAPAAPGGVILVGYRSLGRRLARRCADKGVALRVLDDTPLDEREPIDGGQVEHRIGKPTDAQALRHAGIDGARILLVADLSLPEKMQVCRTARELNPRLAIIAGAANDAEQAWLREFGVRFISSALDEQTEQLARAVRANL
ncbi:MAG: cation:proton antiporter [Burkholderiales bacterium]|nr:cation:proton antiporter [Burkholderiales bacterium]